MRTHPSFMYAVAASVLCVAVSARAQTSATNAPTAGLRDLPVHLLRDPFWPVGWAPPNFGQINVNDSGREALSKWTEARKLLQVTGVSRATDGKDAAILKGIGVVQVGDTVSVNHGDLTYKWKIVAITGDTIVTEKIGAFPMK